VLDVGSGTGILSIFAAQAGAKKVFAVEASNLAQLSRDIVKENDFSAIIEVANCKIEDFKLPAGMTQVDIIISEWMGFYLLHEGMLDSVILARERFLKTGGALFPDRAMICLSPCSLPSLFQDWADVSGVKMTKFAEQLRKQRCTRPEIVTLKKEDLLADEAVIAFLDLNDISSSDLDRFDFNEVIVAKKDGRFEGLCIWFDVFFPSDNDETILSTHPQCEATHWKQTVVPIPEHIQTIEEQNPIAFKLIIQRHPEHFRRYNILLEILDPLNDDVTHPLPCDCNMTKCILTKTHLQSLVGNGLERV
jgi:protein arginine N-methyltransferase 6